MHGSESAAGLREEEHDAERKFHRFRRRHGKAFEGGARLFSLPRRDSFPENRADDAFTVEKPFLFVYSFPSLPSLFLAAAIHPRVCGSALRSP